MRGVWNNKMRKTCASIRHDNRERSVLTCFSATLELRDHETDNFSVINYSFMDVFFLLTKCCAMNLQNGIDIQSCDTSAY